MRLLFSKVLRIALPMVGSVLAIIGYLGDIDFLAHAEDSVWSPMIEFCKQNWGIIIFVMVLVYGILWSNLNVFRQEFVKQADADALRKSFSEAEGRLAAAESTLAKLHERLSATHNIAEKTRTDLMFLPDRALIEREIKQRINELFDNSMNIYEIKLNNMEEKYMKVAYDWNTTFSKVIEHVEELDKHSESIKGD